MSQLVDVTGRPVAQQAKDEQEARANSESRLKRQEDCKEVAAALIAQSMERGTHWMVNAIAGAMMGCYNTGYFAGQIKYGHRVVEAMQKAKLEGEMHITCDHCSQTGKTNAEIPGISFVPYIQGIEPERI